MFITAAYAQTAQAPGGNVLFQMAPFILILVIMYFLILRPQQKKMQQHRDMIAGLKRGDVVVTAGGLVGKVTKLVGDAELQVELAEGVRVRVIRSTVSEVRTRGDVREADARKAMARADADNDDDETSAPEPANDSGGSKKDA